MLCMRQLRTYGDSELYVPETDLVVQFQATPVRLELLKTVFAHLGDTKQTNGKNGEGNRNPPYDQSLLKGGDMRRESQVSCASGYPSTLLQTVSRLSVFRLAEHKVLCMTRIESAWSTTSRICAAPTVELFAVCADEERSTLQGSTRGTDFIDLWGRGRERRRLTERVGRGFSGMKGAHRRRGRRCYVLSRRTETG